MIIASVHFDSEVLPWFQMQQKAGRVPTWLTLTKAIELQFGPSHFDGARSQLFKLTQQGLGGSLETYNSKFLSLANRTDDVSEDAVVDCYIGGLVPSLKRDVLVQRPSTVISAMSLARLFVGSSTSMPPSPTAIADGGSKPRSSYTPPSTTKSFTPYSTPMSGTTKSTLPPLLPTPPIPPIKKMSTAEMQIRREKGLCYTCDAKFTPHHRCPNKHLMLFHCEEDDDPGGDVEPPPEVDATLHHLSLHALRGTSGAATIRFHGNILGIAVQVLLDGGSSDNFLHPRIVQHLGIPIEYTSTVRVLGSTGTILSTNERVLDLPIQISGYTIHVNMFVLAIAAVDVVLGADWLETLGAHVADYSASTIRFILDNDFITLTGYRGSSPMFSTCHHLFRLSHTEAIANCFILESTSLAPPSPIEWPPDLPEDLRHLLLHYATFFSVPTGLPSLELWFIALILNLVVDRLRFVHTVIPLVRSRKLSASWLTCCNRVSFSQALVHFPHRLSSSRRKIVHGVFVLIIELLTPLLLRMPSLCRLLMNSWMSFMVPLTIPSLISVLVITKFSCVSVTGRRRLSALITAFMSGWSCHSALPTRRPPFKLS